MSNRVNFPGREPKRNRKSMPLRGIHQGLPHWIKVLLNPWMKRYGDPGDRPG